MKDLSMKSQKGEDTSHIGSFQPYLLMKSVILCYLHIKKTQSLMSNKKFGYVNHWL